MKLFKNKKEHTFDRRENLNSALRAERYRYHSRRQDIDQYNRGRTETKSPSLVRQIPMVVAGLMVLISFIYFLWLDIQPRVKIQPGSENLLRSEQFYENEINQILAGAPLNRTKLSIDTARVESDIENAYPEVDRAVVIIPLGGHKPIISLQAKKPAVLLTSQQGAFVIDQSGEVLIKAGELTNPGEFSLPKVDDQSGLELKPGYKALTSDMVGFIEQLSHQLTEAKIPVDSYELPGLPNEVRMRAVGKSYAVKFDASQSPRLQAGAYRAVLSRLENQNIVPNEYIDVRVPEKVFYK